MCVRIVKNREQEVKRCRPVLFFFVESKSVCASRTSGHFSLPRSLGVVTCGYVASMPCAHADAWPWFASRALIMLIEGGGTDCKQSNFQGTCRGFRHRHTYCIVRSANGFSLLRDEPFPKKCFGLSSSVHVRNVAVFFFFFIP